MPEDNETKHAVEGRIGDCLYVHLGQVKLNCSEKLELKFPSMYSNLHALNMTFYVGLSLIHFSHEGFHVLIWKLVKGNQPSKE